MQYPESMRVLKFGGSAMRDVDSCRRVVEVITGRARRHGEIVVVVSALYGVTNRLLKIVDDAGRHRLAACRKALREIRAEHQTIASALIPRRQRTVITNRIAAYIAELAELCEGISRVQECSPRTRDRFIGYGELLSSALISAVLQAARVRAVPVDARELIVTDDSFGNANVMARPTRERLLAARRGWRGCVPVVTGFIAATADGTPTTVGRNGSDYTAALIGAMLRAREIEIWTDVDGVMSADPNLVRDAFTLPHLTYAEAMEMAYFGAKVLYPKTVIPAVEAKVPLRILNIFNPDAAGTLISSQSRADGRKRSLQPHSGVEGETPRALPVEGATRAPVIIKGITAISDMSLVSIEGSGMVGVTGVAARMFDALARARVNVTLISQGSSEQSICCVVQRRDGEAARAVLRATFAPEFRRHQIHRVLVRDNIAVVAVVGVGMRGTPGISGRLFGALGKNSINVIGVAQGSSELNISIVVSQPDCSKALNVIHGAFHLAARNVHVVVIGKGRIGSKLLEQIGKGQVRIERDLGLRLRVVGIADRHRFMFRPDGIRLDRWRKAVAGVKGRSSPDRIQQAIASSRLENPVVVDATASEAIARQYPQLLAAGISVVTPNKKANTLSQDFYDRLQQIIRRRNSYYLYETCVGAGLPVLSTLQDLIDSGDQIVRIEAALSGTLGYLFSELERGVAFSEAVREAHRLGFTEPDPREDLSGTDVARKMLILARKAGARLSLADVKVEPLLPKALDRGGVRAFFPKLSSVDGNFRRACEAAARAGKVLRYIGEYRNGRCQVGLVAVPTDSPFGRLRGGDNMVVFTTARYRTNPLIVQGPGAGPDVTAGGVFADILKVAHLLTTT